MALVPPYTFGAIVREVIDGDTLVLDVDHGRRIWLHDQHYRLFGCNAREHDQPGGPEATANLGILTNRRVLISSLKPGKDIDPDKYGDRWLAHITVEAGGQPADLVSLLLSSGWVARWNGRGAKPVPAWPRPAGLPEFDDLLRDGQLAAVRP